MLAPTQKPFANAAVDVDLSLIGPLIEDDTVTDILINGCNNIYVERRGKLEMTNITYPNEEEVLKLAHSIAKAVGREIYAGRPITDARLMDGSRVNIIAPPLAVDGTMISIRKFSRRRITLDMMAEQGNISEQMAEFLKACGKSRLNIMISGGTGSGKTTLLNAITEYIDIGDRVVTVEDAAELQLHQPHVIRLETKPFNINSAVNEEVTIRDLVKNSLRMRPDRIVVGEVRGSEAFDMMQAMNTGHEGSLTTIHSNHPRDAMARIESMITMANPLMPVKTIRAQIASALHLVIQVSRMRDGKRRVTHISEITGMESDVLSMQDLFHFVPKGSDDEGNIQGEFQWMQIVPRFIRRVSYWGEAKRLADALGINVPVGG